MRLQRGVGRAHLGKLWPHLAEPGRPGWAHRPFAPPPQAHALRSNQKMAVRLGAGLRWSLLAISIAWQLPGRPAHADGAFPDSQNIITPAAIPNEILLATNFGLVMSVDAGQ